VCTLVDAEGARRSGSAVAYTLWIFALTGVIFGAWAAIARRDQFPPFLIQNWRLSLVAGAGALCSYGAALWAMTMAPVAVVAALRETTVLFGAAFAWLVLNEKIGRSRLLAILIIAGGAIIMRFSLSADPSV
jgi:drug/metabolite transporter (DMT)-like permease